MGLLIYNNNVSPIPEPTPTGLEGFIFTNNSSTVNIESFSYDDFPFDLNQGDQWVLYPGLAGSIYPTPTVSNGNLTATTLSGEGAINWYLYKNGDLLLGPIPYNVPDNTLCVFGNLECNELDTVEFVLEDQAPK